MLRYAISDVAPHAVDFAGRWDLLKTAIRRWSAEGVDYVQLREKSLPAGELFRLAADLAQELRELRSSTRLLINSRADIALAAGAHGVHLTAAPGEMTPAQVRVLFAERGGCCPVISVSCHTAEEAKAAGRNEADVVLFGPVFEKVVQGRPTAAGAGLERLAEAVRLARPTPVLALGGVTASHLGACLEAGAAGVAGIRLFTGDENTRRLTMQ